MSSSSSGGGGGGGGGRRSSQRSGSVSGDSDLFGHSSDGDDGGGSDYEHHITSDGRIERRMENPADWAPDWGQHVPPPYEFELIEVNEYVNRARKELDYDDANVCSCSVGPDDEAGCTASCMNRMVQYECAAEYCPCGELCSNQSFERKANADVEVYRTKMKGCGLRTKSFIKAGTFVIEYVGEVIDVGEFQRRVRAQAAEHSNHFYFMSLTTDEFLDAFHKGNVSRFMNHSCDPNCETQKWDVRGETRIGLFAKRDIPANTELTFDYQFENYGAEPQKCFCGSANCRGTLGGAKAENRYDFEESEEESDEDSDEPAAKRRRVKEETYFDDDPLYGPERIKIDKHGGFRVSKDVTKIMRLMLKERAWETRAQIAETILKTTRGTVLVTLSQENMLRLLNLWVGDARDSVPKSGLLVAVCKLLLHLPFDVRVLNQQTGIRAAIDDLRAHPVQEVKDHANEVIAFWEQLEKAVNKQQSTAIPVFEVDEEASRLRWEEEQKRRSAAGSQVTDFVIGGDANSMMSRMGSMSSYGGGMDGSSRAGPWASASGGESSFSASYYGSSMMGGGRDSGMGGRGGRGDDEELEYLAPLGSEATATNGGGGGGDFRDRGPRDYRDGAPRDYRDSRDGQAPRDYRDGPRDYRDSDGDYHMGSSRGYDRGDRSERRRDDRGGERDSERRRDRSEGGGTRELTEAEKKQFSAVQLSSDVSADALKKIELKAQERVKEYLRKSAAVSEADQKRLKRKRKRQEMERRERELKERLAKRGSKRDVLAVLGRMELKATSKKKEKAAKKAGVSLSSTKTRPLKIKDFREKISKLVTSKLKPYLESGAIEDRTKFKKLARKMTHAVMEKEQREVGADAKTLPYGESTKTKVAKYISSYFERRDGGRAKPADPATGSAAPAAGDGGGGDGGRLSVTDL